MEKCTNSTFIRICIFIIATCIIAITSCADTAPEKETNTFVDSTGIEWSVLIEDEGGNKLIITERVHGVRQSGTGDYSNIVGAIRYNSSNNYTLLRQSDGLQPALVGWYVDCLAPELKANALPVENIDYDVRTTSFMENTAYDEHYKIYLENEPIGWTKAGSGLATAENALFVLSISEVNKYLEMGTLEIQGTSYLSELDRYVYVSWWLRSPGFHNYYGPVSMVSTGYDTDGPLISSSRTDERAGFRPALWVRDLSN